MARAWLKVPAEVREQGWPSFAENAAAAARAAAARSILCTMMSFVFMYVSEEGAGCSGILAVKECSQQAVYWSSISFINRLQ